MKTLRLNSAAAGVLLLALITAGCEHKKPVLVMPQQPPPTATPQATPTPTEAEAQPAQQPPEALPTPTPAEPQAAGKTAEKSKPKHPRHAAGKKPGEKSEVAHNTPKKIIPAEPAPTPQQTGQISPGPTPADGGNSQASTDQLLQGAEANLNGITRTLSKDEEAMRAQIREFIKQSRTATTENDPARAHTLAVKARLLSDELVKQR